MDHQIPLDAHARADHTGEDGLHHVIPDVAYLTLAFVNVVFVGRPSSVSTDGWVLVDAGLNGRAGRIVKAADERFGAGTRPSAIVMTHGHFDHVGALEHLAERWEVPIYAHELEHPYLNGSAEYPPPDPSVGGMMARLSPLFPRGPINVSRWLRTLPSDRSVPGMPGWRWLHTPGHTPGQISLWRETDRTLIAGDAFVTTAPESAYAALTARPEMHGPPKYLTTDWTEARASVERLAALEPDVVVTGHGHAMRGGEMRAALRTLAREFDRVAVPRHGRYVDEPPRAR